MSTEPSEAVSDDEFQDALSDDAAVPQELKNESAGTTTNDKVQELVDKQMGLTLNDGDSETDPLENKSTEETEEPADDDIEEDELRELEKSLTPEQIESNKETAHKMKLEANELFKNGEAEEAICIYSKALKICPTTCSNERAVLYGNRAAAKIKLDYKKSALTDCSEAIKLWPDYVRVRIRRAKLYEHEDKLDLALEDYKHVFEIDPGNAEARASCLRLTPIVNERNEKLKEEMMGKLKDLGNMILKPFGLSTSNFQMQQDPSTGSYSINFNQNSS